MDEVSLSPDATAKCVAACDAYLQGIQKVAAATVEGARKDAFGTLPSGQALGQKFVDVGIGQTYSLDTVLRQHVEVITRLKSAFAEAGLRYRATDEQNAANLTAQQPN